MWVVAKIKSYSQERIIKRTSFLGETFKANIKEFYSPFYIRENDTKKRLTSSLLFIDFEGMDFDLITKWLEFEPYLYWFYNLNGTMSIIEESEIKRFKKGVEDYIKKKIKGKIHVGKIAKIVNPPALAGYKGRIKSVRKTSKGVYVVLEIFDIELRSEWELPLKCVSLCETKESEKEIR